MELELILQAVRGMNYLPCENEAQLELQVIGRLERAGIAFRRQYVASKKDRFDFLVGEGIVLELKVDGSTGMLLRQVERYAQYDYVTAILVITTRASHRQLRDIGTIHGKSVGVVHVGWL